MRSVIVGMGSLFMCILVFVICAMIQMNSNIALELNEAANEAAYQSMLSLTEDDVISTDEQLEKNFIQNAGLMLEGSSTYEAYKDSREYGTESTP